MKADQHTKQVSLIAYFENYGLLIILSIIWGLAFVAIRELVLELSFVDLTLLRWFVASAGYLALMPFIGKSKAPLNRADIPRLLFVGFLSVPGYHLCLNYAEVTVSAGLAGLLISTGPVFSTLLAAFFLKEKVGVLTVTALVFAVGGATILSAGDFSTGGGLSGPIAVVLAALSFATFGVFSQPLVKKYGALPVAIWAGIVGTIMILPLVSTTFFIDVSKLSPVGWGALFYLSLLCTVLCYSLFFRLVERSGVSRLMIQLYLVPVVGVVGGVLLLGETITASTFLGGALIMFAVWLATRKKT